MSPLEKDEIIEKFDDQKKKPHGRFTCVLIALVCFVLFASFILWEVAATGLVTIPVVSSVAFVHPKPVRVVEAGVPVEQLSESVFKTTLAKRLQAGGGMLSDRSILIAIPESSLTASLRKALKNFPDANLDASRAQIAVLPDQKLELFLPVRFNDRSSVLIAHISLVADQGLFDLRLLDVKLGSFRAPSMLVSSLIQPFVNRALTSLNQSLSSYMHVDSLKTEEGILNASGTFTVEVKK